MTRLGIATFSETPTTTMVDTSRFRSTASRSVPPIGPTPCQRLRTRSVGSGPNSGNTAAPGVPGVMSTPRCPTAKILALWLEPSPSGRRCTKQCTMRTPAVRAVGNNRVMLGSATRRASFASTASPAFGHSCATIAVCAGAASAASGVMRAALPRKRVGVPPAAQRRGGVPPPHRFALHCRRRSCGHFVELSRPFPQCHIPFGVDLGECWVFHVLLVAPDLQIVEHGGQELLFDDLAQLAFRHIGGVAGTSRPPDRVEQVGALVIDRRAGENQPMILRALEDADRAAETEQMAVEP